MTILATQLSTSLGNSRESLYQQFHADLKRRKEAISEAAQKAAPTDPTGQFYQDKILNLEEAHFKDPQNWFDWIILKKRQYELTYFYTYEPLEKVVIYGLMLSLFGLVIYYYLR